MNTGKFLVCFVAGVIAFSGWGVEAPAVRIVTAAGDLVVPNASGGKVVKVAANPSAARLSERTASRALRGRSVRQGTLGARMTELAGRNYTRYVVELGNRGSEAVLVDRFELLKDFTPGGRGERVGQTDGAVAVFPDVRTYVGVENPLAKVTVEQGKVSAVLERGFAIAPGERWTVSYVIGTYRDKQLRRDFHEYLNRERAHPYRVLPHYNSWYDINIGRNDAPWEKRMNEAESLGVMVAFREALSKRGVFINSYLWDDGWDDWDSLWDFHPGFPNGFKKHAEEAHRNKGASIGCWMSPCGGYGGSHARRVKYAREKGYIKPTDNLLRLSSPTYYAAFRDRVIKMIKDYDMNLFKFDRMGCGRDCEGAGKEYAPDIDGVVRLISEMRDAKPDVFVNATVGTWASPFWVMYADSIWRGGGDFGTQGAGTKRQQWLTYRDDVIYDRFVTRSPLFPMNAMMMHGIIVNRGGPPTCMDISDSPQSTQDFADEVWMAVAAGYALQEYYITPGLMHETWWDILADGIKWLKANESILGDTHWVGGDPWSKGGGIYGYASYLDDQKQGRGIVILRNSAAEPKMLTTSLGDLLELGGLARAQAAVSGFKVVYAHGAAFPKPATAAQSVDVKIDPFGVILVEIGLK